MPSIIIPFGQLQDSLLGDVHYDTAWRMMYATDASVYRELPTAVCLPKNADDMKQILAFAANHKLSVTARTAGTSLAGQVVASGLIVDFSKYMNRILDFNAQEKWVKVEPGVIPDELNKFLKPYSLYFGPETSTSNRCMVGGMVANNSCGANSMVYGSTRDHTIAIKAILSDGSQAEFGPISKPIFLEKCKQNNLEGSIYRNIQHILSTKENIEEIVQQYPAKAITRRNTGYALDLLIQNQVFSDETEPFNFCKLLAGSEGTLAIFTEITLNLVPLPPPIKMLFCIHLNNVQEALRANLVALKHKPVAIELLDKNILDCSKENISQNRNRFFVNGDPGAILVVEFAAYAQHDIDFQAGMLEKELREKGLGYWFTSVSGSDMGKVWALRKAGLGVLSNMAGDAKPITVIEDTALPVESLPEFYQRHNQILERLGLECVYYAHVGSGEVHMKPILNLKLESGRELFRTIAHETALLVKEYGGSLSGEHGDGRLRGEFIPIMLGEKVYQMLRSAKKAWDPNGLLNPGKITDAPPMIKSLRYDTESDANYSQYAYDYTKTLGFLRAIENCNGSGDCRKPHTAAGTMCPSYQATLSESDSTRGRANVLREILSRGASTKAFTSKEIDKVLTLCLSCKACKSECPSNLDMARFKSEMLYQRSRRKGIPLSAFLVANATSIRNFGTLLPMIYNAAIRSRLLSAFIKKLLGFANERALPIIPRKGIRHLIKYMVTIEQQPAKHVLLFCDEFTNTYEPELALKAYQLLTSLGYRVELIERCESGRAAISKGLLQEAKRLAMKNVALLAQKVTDDCPLVGIEPSAILCFRDEYPELLRGKQQEQAHVLAQKVFTFEEFIIKEFKAGNIETSRFRPVEKEIFYHAHCHQKALQHPKWDANILGIIPESNVTVLDCGCCGMAGSFGYEAKSYSTSMRIAELKLFPAIKATPVESIITTSGTSCRQQILHGTNRKVLHPIDILLNALKDNGA